MKRFKIVLLSAAYPYRGGIAQFTDYLKQYLSEKHDVNVVTFKKQYPDILFPGKTQYVTSSDIKPIELPDRWLNTVNPVSYYTTAKKIKALHPDVYISRFWMPFFGPSMGYIAKLIGKKALRLAILDNVIPHEKRRFDTSFTTYFLKHHDGFICLSEKVKQELLTLQPDAKVKLINHPIYDQFGAKPSREEALRNLGLPSDRHYILFFGFIRNYKGLDVLLNAMKSVDPSVELIIAGEIYGSFEQYAKIIEENQLSDRIHLFTDYIPDNEVGRYFAASEAMVLPYKSATQSGLSAIALNFECPTIATNVGGLAEVVLHNQNGLIVEPENSGQLAMAINRYFHEELKAEFVEALKQEKAIYSWDNFTRELIDFIESFNLSTKK